MAISWLIPVPSQKHKYKSGCLTDTRFGKLRSKPICCAGFGVDLARDVLTKPNQNYSARYLQNWYVHADSERFRDGFDASRRRPCTVNQRDKPHSASRGSTVGPGKLLEILLRVATSTRPLNRARSKYGFLGFLTRARGRSGGPREAPQSPARAFPGSPRASRRPPGPKTNQRNKSRNL
jgi:hypothetical protein